MRKGHTYGVCKACGKTHIDFARRIRVTCENCGVIKDLYRPPIVEYAPRFCGNKCYREYTHIHGLSLEQKLKQRKSVKKYISEHMAEWYNLASNNGKRLQASGQSYKRPVGVWRPTPEMRQKVRLGVLRMYREHPEAIEKIRKSRANQKFPFADTSIERAVKAGLDALNIKYESQYYVQGASLIDIALPSKKVAIYCDGDYWHSLAPAKRRDAYSNESLKSQGWHVLRFSEHEINGNLESCISQVRGVIA